MSFIGIIFINIFIKLYIIYIIFIYKYNIIMLSELFENIKVYARYVIKNNLNCSQYWNEIYCFLNAPSQKSGLEKINRMYSIFI